MPVQQYIGYDNAVTISNVSADSSQSSYPVTNLANPATNLLWKSDSTSAQYVTIDSAATQDCDYIGIAGHNLGSAECDVEIEGQTTDGGAWSSIVSQFSPANDRPILKTFTSDDYYGVRIKITPGGSTKPQIAVVYTGEIMQMQRNIYIGHTPITYARSVDTVSGFSESGQFLGRIIKATTHKSKVSMSNMTKEWFRSTFDAFVLASKTVPFFYSWRLTDYATEIGYCWVTGGVPVPDNTGPSGMMSVSFSISGLA
ncbi:hypothetical protein [Prosthecochloris sp.]|uniref:hypothetical protein n=1 Tax=Prosthecochloris sp. TaxID=290513 RepID=UPI0025CDFAF1|nr:hypothetical protein [Prosthecochloris sp.]